MAPAAGMKQSRTASISTIWSMAIFITPMMAIAMIMGR
jgi:hypothetical protein